METSAHTDQKETESSLEFGSDPKTVFKKYIEGHPQAKQLTEVVKVIHSTLPAAKSPPASVKTPVDNQKEAKEKAKQYAVAKGWLPSAVKELRGRLELEEGEGDSKAIHEKSKGDPKLGANSVMDDAQKKDFLARSALYSAENPNGCGTTDYKEWENYPFCHLRFTHDIAEDGKSVTVKPADQYLQGSSIAVVCIDYQDYRRLVKLPDSKTLTSNYKQKTLETLRAYNGLNVEPLFKGGDGMGVFLDRHDPGNGGREMKRSPKEVAAAKAACLDGFFEALTEFYNGNPQAKLQKITFVTIDAPLVESFKVKLKAWQASDKNIKGLTIEADVSDMKFKVEECLAKNPDQKLGITMAPNENHEFLGGVLGGGNVLEEQMAALSDMASIGNPKFNPIVKTKVDLASIAAASLQDSLKAPQVKKTREESWQDLITAVRGGKLEEVQKILKEAGDWKRNLVNNEGKYVDGDKTHPEHTALYYAVMAKKSVIVQALLDAGMAIFHLNPCFNQAVQNGDLETVKVLLDAAGSRDRSWSEYSRKHPLQEAVLSGNLEVVKILNERGFAPYDEHRREEEVNDLLQRVLKKKAGKEKSILAIEFLADAGVFSMIKVDAQDVEELKGLKQKVNKKIESFVSKKPTELVESQTISGFVAYHNLYKYLHEGGKLDALDIKQDSHFWKAVNSYLAENQGSVRELINTLFKKTDGSLGDVFNSIARDALGTQATTRLLPGEARHIDEKRKLFVKLLEGDLSISMKDCVLWDHYIYETHDFFALAEVYKARAKEIDFSKCPKRFVFKGGYQDVTMTGIDTTVKKFAQKRNELLLQETLEVKDLDLSSMPQKDSFLPMVLFSRDHDSQGGQTLYAKIMAMPKGKNKNDLLNSVKVELAKVRAARYYVKEIAEIDAALGKRPADVPVKPKVEDEKAKEEKDAEAAKAEEAQPQQQAVTQAQTTTSTPVKTPQEVAQEVQDTGKKATENEATSFIDESANITPHTVTLETGSVTASQSSSSDSDARSTAALPSSQDNERTNIIDSAQQKKQDEPQDKKVEDAKAAETPLQQSGNQSLSGHRTATRKQLNRTTPKQPIPVVASGSELGEGKGKGVGNRHVTVNTEKQEIIEDKEKQAAAGNASTTAAAAAAAASPPSPTTPLQQGGNQSLSNQVTATRKSLNRTTSQQPIPVVASGSELGKGKGKGVGNRHVIVNTEKQQIIEEKGGQAAAATATSATAVASPPSPTTPLQQSGNQSLSGHRTATRKPLNRTPPKQPASGRGRKKEEDGRHAAADVEKKPKNQPSHDAKNDRLKDLNQKKRAGESKESFGVGAMVGGVMLAVGGIALAVLISGMAALVGGIALAVSAIFMAAYGAAEYNEGTKQVVENVSEIDKLSVPARAPAPDRSSAVSRENIKASKAPATHSHVMD